MLHIYFILGHSKPNSSYQTRGFSPHKRPLLIELMSTFAFYLEKVKIIYKIIEFKIRIGWREIGMLVFLHLIFHNCILNWMHLLACSWLLSCFAVFRVFWCGRERKSGWKTQAIGLITCLFISLLTLNTIILDILQIKNLSAMEVNIVRPFIGRALQAFYKHDSPDLIPDPERVSDRRPQAANNNAPRVCLFDILRNVYYTQKRKRI